MIVNKFPMAAGGHIYGVSWNGTSTTAWTRTDESALFAHPVPYTNGASSYESPFDTLSPWKDMVIVEDSAAGTMVKIPKFWYKLEQTSGNGMKIQIADYAESGFSVCPACMDRGDGAGERDYVLVGRYHCASNYKSITGNRPKALITREVFRSAIKELGTGIYMMDFATRFTIWLLYLVEFADWNSQANIGYGCGNNSATENMGYTDSMPYHTGTTKSYLTTYGLGTQYRHIEGLWDNVLDFVDGCYYKSNGLYIIMNPKKASESSNGILIGTTPSGRGVFPRGFSVKNVNGTFPIFIPNKDGGSNSTYSCDMWECRMDGAIITGGYYNKYDSLGLFAVFTSMSSSSTFGARSMKLP